MASRQVLRRDERQARKEAKASYPFHAQIDRTVSSAAAKYFRDRMREWRNRNTIKV